MCNYQFRVHNSCGSLELGKLTEETGVVQSKGQLFKENRADSVNVPDGHSYSPFNDTAILCFLIFPFLPLPSARKKKNINPPPPPATLFIGFLSLILVKDKFCSVWILNLISVSPHFVIKLMVCPLCQPFFFNVPALPLLNNPGL